MPKSAGYTKAPNGTPERPTGARPTPRHRLASAVPFRAHAEAPASHWRIPKKLSYWYNNQYGVCVTTESAFAKACDGMWMLDATVLKWAEEHRVLNGAFIDECLDWMAEKGFSQDGNLYNEGRKSSVDFTKWNVLAAALYAGPVKIGLASAQLQRVVGGKNGWFLDGARDDQGMDHAVSLCGYGTVQEMADALDVSVPRGVDPHEKALLLFTWNTIGVITHESLICITGEAWLRSPTTVVKGNNPHQPVEVETPDGPGPGPEPVEGGVYDVEVSGPIGWFGSSVTLTGTATPRLDEPLEEEEEEPLKTHKPANTPAPAAEAHDVNWIALLFACGKLVMDVARRAPMEIIEADILDVLRHLGLAHRFSGVRQEEHEEHEQRPRR